jgi:hypothetical protein
MKAGATVPVMIVSLVVFVEEVKVSHILDRMHKGYAKKNLAHLMVVFLILF